jgi:hypothetical protein
METIKFFMVVIAPLSILPPIVFAFLRWRYLKANDKMLLWYLLMSALINTIGTIVGRVFHQNNMPLVHILTVLEILILLQFYNQLLAHSSKKILYGVVGVTFALLCVVNAIFFQYIYAYCSYTRSIAAIIIMLFAINYFAKIAAEENEKSYLSPSFIFNSALFLYYAGAFMLFVFSNFTLVDSQSQTNFYVIWGLHACLVVLMNILFTIGFILCKK